jgi:hypothetical protein
VTRADTADLTALRAVLCDCVEAIDRAEAAVKRLCGALSELSMDDQCGAFGSQCELSRDSQREAAEAPHADRAQREDRTAAVETIGCALTVLRRLVHARFDPDIRDTVTKARAALSVAQSKIKERLNG